MKTRLLKSYYLVPVFIIFIYFCFHFSIAQTTIKKVENPDPERFATEIQNFRNWDNKNTFPEDAVLFVGSSSIRMWETNLYFEGFPVINRGFGGSHISDVNYYFESVVRKYHPQAIIFYAGDNDIAAGKEIAQVVTDYKTFVKMVEEKCPATPIVFIAVKPSLARWSFWPQMHETNQRIGKFSQQKTNLYFLDISSSMLDQSGNQTLLFLSMTASI